MSERFKMQHVLPEPYKALAGIDSYIRTSGISPINRELIKIRASQINGCAYCVDLHTREARRLGETEQRIYVLSVWREAKNLFSDEELLLIEMTEEITLIHRHGLSDRLYEKAIDIWGEERTAYVIFAIISINAWNRIGVGLNLHPELRVPATV